MRQRVLKAKQTKRKEKKPKSLEIDKIFVSRKQDFLVEKNKLKKKMEMDTKTLRSRPPACQSAKARFFPACPLPSVAAH